MPWHVTAEAILSGTRRELNVVIVVYDDGEATTHYFPTGDELRPDNEIRLGAREPGYVSDGSSGAEEPWLLIDEPGLNVSHRVTPKPGTEAADVVRVLVARRRHHGVEVTDPGPADDRRPRPRGRLVRDAREAEELAAEWVRWMGFPTACTTPLGQEVDDQCSALVSD